MSKNNQDFLEFLKVYWLAFFIVIIIAFLLIYFATIDVTFKNKLPADPRAKMNFICHNLIKKFDGAQLPEIYPFLDQLGKNLKNKSKATDVFFDYDAVEVRSDLKVFDETNAVFCVLPVKICYTDVNEFGRVLYEVGSLCQLWELETPIFIQQFEKWYLRNTTIGEGQK